MRPTLPRFVETLNATVTKALPVRMELADRDD
jgi:hypothetical protein